MLVPENRPLNHLGVLGNVNLGSQDLFSKEGWKSGLPCWKDDQQRRTAQVLVPWLRFQSPWEPGWWLPVPLQIMSSSTQSNEGPTRQLITRATSSTKIHLSSISHFLALVPSWPQQQRQLLTCTLWGTLSFHSGKSLWEHLKVVVPLLLLICWRKGGWLSHQHKHRYVCRSSYPPTKCWTHRESCLLCSV